MVEPRVRGERFIGGTGTREDERQISQQNPSIYSKEYMPVGFSLKGLVTTGTDTVKFKTLHSCHLPGICGNIGEEESSNRSSIDSWIELWHKQDDWGSRGNPRAIESE